MSKICKLINLPEHPDARGNLIVMEKALPFDVKRVYWICGAADQTRGGHRHIKNRQALVALNGVVRIDLEQCKKSERCSLVSPKQCLLIEPDVWHWMTFSEGAILLVFASEYFDKTDYLHKGA